VRCMCVHVSVGAEGVAAFEWWAEPYLGGPSPIWVDRALLL